MHMLLVSRSLALCILLLLGFGAHRAGADPPDDIAFIQRSFDAQRAAQPRGTRAG